MSAPAFTRRLVLTDAGNRTHIAYHGSSQLLAASSASVAQA